MTTVFKDLQLAIGNQLCSGIGVPHRYNGVSGPPHHQRWHHYLRKAAGQYQTLFLERGNTAAQMKNSAGKIIGIATIVKLDILNFKYSNSPRIKIKVCRNKDRITIEDWNIIADVISLLSANV